MARETMRVEIYLTCCALLVLPVFIVYEVHACATPWAKLGDICYYFSTNQSSWLDSEKFCRRLDAVLATVDTTEKADFLVQLMSVLSGAGRTSYWVGGSDLVHTGQWRWLDSGKAIGHFFWTVDSPSGNPGFNCILMDYSIGNASNWRDNPCEYTFYSICQKPNNVTHGIVNNNRKQ